MQVVNRPPFVLIVKKPITVNVINYRYFGAYVFLPKELLFQVADDFKEKLPPNYYLATNTSEPFVFITSEWFLRLLRMCYAVMIWPSVADTCRLNDNIAVYSLVDPVVNLICSNIDLWIIELMERGSIKSQAWFEQNLSPDQNLEFGDWDFVTEEIDAVTPDIIEKNNFRPIIEHVRKNRCFEDFSYIQSRQKIDFYRKWYHTRTKHSERPKDGNIIDLLNSDTSLEEAAETVSYVDTAEYIISQQFVNDFLAILSDKDRDILELRMEHYSYEDIAKKLGYRNHSGVIKRIKKIGEAYEFFSGCDLGF